MRKKILVMILTFLIVIALLLPVVYAYMFRSVEPVISIFDPANVKCKVVETFENDIKSSITVKNTGNTDAYIRVRLVIHWEDSKGNVVSRDVDFSKIAIVNRNDWLADSSEFTYYYKKPVAADALTGELLGKNIELYAKVEDVDENGVTVKYYYYPVIEVVAEAIQALPTNAVVESWGVTLDENGNITAVTGGS